MQLYFTIKIMVAQKLKKIQDKKQAVRHISTTRRHLTFGQYTVQQTIVRYTVVNNESRRALIKSFMVPKPTDRQTKNI